MNGAPGRLSNGDSPRADFFDMPILLHRLAALLFFVSPAVASAQTQNGVVLVEPALLADTRAVVPGKPFMVGVHLRMAPHWHTYWKYAGDSGMPTELDWELPPGFKAGEIQWPLPGTINEEGDLQTYAYQDEVLLLVQITPPAYVEAKEVSLKVKARWLVCEKICVPGEATLSLALPVAQTSEPANAELFAKFSALLPESRGPPFQLAWESGPESLTLRVSGLRDNQALEFFPLPPAGVLIGHPQVNGSAVTIPIEKNNVKALPGLLVVKEGAARAGWLVGDAEPTATASKAGGSLTWFLLLGVIGGFILNLMPCVLPVIALKIFGFVQQAGETRARILRLGLAFVAGIFAWFLALAALLSIFKAAGHELNWAFQFQHPGFVIAMMVIVLVFALNLLGAFELFLPAAANTRLVEMSAREGYGGAFLHGAFATLMATPCTAPFLGPALGFAFAQSPLIIFAMFGAIATGMSLPYLVLSAQPAWIKFLPKPGMWMVRVKQAMGVLLVGTFLWLGWVLWQQQTNKSEPFAPQLERALGQGKTVFVDFTADWCVNCKVNERLVLNTEPIQRAFRERDIIFLKADWTRGDPGITEILRGFGRAGVPVYAIYPGGRRDNPILLPELLTQKTVLDALGPARP